MPAAVLSAFRDSVAGFAVCDRRLRLLGVNRALAEMDGLPVEAHVGRKLGDVLGALAPQTKAALQHAFRRSRPPQFRTSIAIPSKTKDGYYLLDCFPLATRQPSCAALLVIDLTRDITDALLRQLILADKDGQRLLLRALRLGIPKVPFRLEPERNTAPRGGTVSRASTSESIDETAPASPAWASVAARGKQSANLSPREREVVGLVADGRSNKQISVMLSISVKTVETYRTRLMLKLNVHSVAELVRYALLHHLSD